MKLMPWASAKSSCRCASRSLVCSPQGMVPKPLSDTRSSLSPSLFSFIEASSISQTGNALHHNVSTAPLFHRSCISDRVRPWRASEARASKQPTLAFCVGGPIGRDQAQMHAAVNHNGVAGEEIRALDQPDDDGGDF